VFDGGLGTSPKTLELALNLTSYTQSVTFTLDFSALYVAGVSNVSLTIFDVGELANGLQIDFSETPSCYT
jgi:hypothetical protein